MISPIGIVFRPNDAGIAVITKGGFREPDQTCYNHACFKLMQYTGFKDSHGTEIYEADVMKWTGEIDPPGEGLTLRAKVLWNEKAGCFDLCSPQLEEGEILGCAGSEGWEVIGNIYENPELAPEKE